MSKKKKQPQSSSPSPPPPPPSVDLSAAVDPETAGLDAAFRVGNFSLVRDLIAKANSAAAKATGDRLMDQVKVDRDQVVVGLIGLAVVLIVCALTLTR